LSFLVPPAKYQTIIKIVVKVKGQGERSPKSYHFSGTPNYINFWSAVFQLLRGHTHTDRPKAITGFAVSLASALAAF